VVDLRFEEPARSAFDPATEVPADYRGEATPPSMYQKWESFRKHFGDYRNLYLQIQTIMVPKRESAPGLQSLGRGVQFFFSREQFLQGESPLKFVFRIGLPRIWC
jgi:hypothetical protein